MPVSNQANEGEMNQNRRMTEETILNAAISVLAESSFGQLYLSVMTTGEANTLSLVIDLPMARHSHEVVGRECDICSGWSKEAKSIRTYFAQRIPELNNRVVTRRSNPSRQENQRKTGVIRGVAKCY